MDTVHPVGSFGVNPTKIVDDIVYGPGVIDCKGGLVAAFMAMDALERSGFKDRPIKLILQSDEENGSRFSNKSTVHFMIEKAKDCAILLNTEPYYKGGVCVSMKGIRKYSFEVFGRSVHSSICYNGKSAILEAAHKIINLESFKDGNTITCNCGLINGGVAENTVPNKCVFTADFRFKNDIQGKQVEEIATKIAEKSFIEGTSCKLTLKSWRYPMEKTQTKLILCDKINAIYKEVGLPTLTPFESNGAADSSDFTHEGIPCLECLGTCGDKIHTVEEFMYKKSLVECAKRLASVAYCIE
jgi:glutamate carboxypeptidase